MVRKGIYRPDGDSLEPDPAGESMLRKEEASRLAGDSFPLSDELDDLITTLGMEGIDLSPEGKLPSERRPRTDSEFDIADDENSGALDKTSDPVRLYLRQMGTVPLLTRAGEVALAKQFERGHMRARLEETICKINAIKKDYKIACALAEKLEEIDQTKHPQAVSPRSLEARAQEGCGIKGRAELQIHVI